MEKKKYKNRLKKIVYINIMFTFCLVFGIYLLIKILSNHHGNGDSVELAIINGPCLVLFIVPGLGWIIECVALFHISLKTKIGSIITKEKEKNENN